MSFYIISIDFNVPVRGAGWLVGNDLCIRRGASRRACQRRRYKPGKTDRLRKFHEPRLRLKSHLQFAANTRNCKYLCCALGTTSICYFLQS